MLRRGLFTVLCAVSRALERAARLVGYAAAGTAQLDDIRRGVHAEGEGADAAAWESYVTSGLTWWERDFYLKHLDPRDRILVVGCGAGRELLALRQEGYRADGLDVAPRCTTLAREVLAARGLTAEIYAGAIEEITLPARFDAVIFSIWLYSHIPHAELRIETLRKVRAQLAPGGKILISYAVHEGPARRFPIRLARFIARGSRSDWRPEDGDVVSLDSGGKHIVRFEHRFAPGAFEREAEAAGLSASFHDPRDGRAVLVSRG